MIVDDPAVFDNFVINNLGVTTQQTIDVTTNILESFGELLAVNDGDIDKSSRIPIQKKMPERLHIGS